MGTSTGGIIAIGLGLGLSAKEILRFYEEHGPTIFCGNRFARTLRQLGISKYDAAGLREALEVVFGDRRLGESTRRLVVVPQQVVPIQAESADGGHSFETGVRSVPIVAVEPGARCWARWAEVL